jgi:hypothetical protein
LQNLGRFAPRDRGDADNPCQGRQRHEATSFRQEGVGRIRRRGSQLISDDDDEEDAVETLYEKPMAARAAQVSEKIVENPAHPRWSLARQ